MGYELPRVLNRHGADDLESLHQLLARLVVGNAGLAPFIAVSLAVGRMAMETGTGLLEFQFTRFRAGRNAQRFILVAEHVVVATLFLVIEGKRVTLEQRSPHGVLVHLL